MFPERELLPTLHHRLGSIPRAVQQQECRHGLRGVGLGGQQQIAVSRPRTTNLALRDMRGPGGNSGLRDSSSQQRQEQQAFTTTSGEPSQPSFAHAASVRGRRLISVAFRFGQVPAACGRESNQAAARAEVRFQKYLYRQKKFVADISQIVHLK